MDRKQTGKLLAIYNRVQRQDIIDIQAHVISKVVGFMEQSSVPADMQAEALLALMHAVGIDWVEIEALVVQSKEYENAND